jgi:hypothetical protein
LKYALTFDQNGFPPIVQGYFGFWSITIYDSSYNLVSGSKNYNINSYDPKFQKRQADGGMTILIQHEQPSLADGVYWLQAPAPSDSPDPTEPDFFLILRVYVPGPEVSGAQTWQPPQIASV